MADRISRPDLADATDRFVFERVMLAEGRSAIAGIDEAGRGPLAGPVVAAAVILPREWIEGTLPGVWRSLNDSKKLTDRTRRGFFDLIQQSGEVGFHIAEVSAEEIDRVNILQATHSAMALALAGLPRQPDGILVDGLPVRTLPSHQKAVVKGDARSFSIAAASVLAKVTRDRIMERFDAEFPGYGFAAHKGYGTAAHLRAIRELGPCPIHRRSFAPLRTDQRELFE